MTSREHQSWSRIIRWMMNKMTYVVRAKWLRTWFDDGKSRETAESKEPEPFFMLTPILDAGGPLSDR